MIPVQRKSHSQRLTRLNHVHAEWLEADGFSDFASGTVAGYPRAALVHSGAVICGTIGHGVAKRMTVMGDNGNIAIRIESAPNTLPPASRFSASANIVRGRA